MIQTNCEILLVNKNPRFEGHLGDNSVLSISSYARCVIRIL